MLLHDFLRRKATIIAKAKAEIDNLLTEISDPKTKEAVDDWEPGDPITDEYAQVDQQPKKEGVEAVDAKASQGDMRSFVSDTHLEDHGGAKKEGAGEVAKAIAPVVPDPIPPVIDESAKPEDNTNHTA